jgi:hypothetical protein
MHVCGAGYTVRSMDGLSRGRLAAAAGIACAFSMVLVGCSAPSSGGAAPPSAESTPTGSPTPTEDAETVDFGFDAPAASSAQIASVEWAVPLARVERFEVLSPDDGEGHWSFTDTSNECRLDFFQGSIADVPNAADDRATSDAIILRIFKAEDANLTPEVVEQYAEDAEVSLWEQSGRVGMRAFGGQAADGASRADIVRRFGALDFDVYLSVTCPPGDQDAFAELEELVAKALIAVAAHDSTG